MATTMRYINSCFVQKYQIPCKNRKQTNKVTNVCDISLLKNYQYHQVFSAHNYCYIVTILLALIIKFQTVQTTPPSISNKFGSFTVISAKPCQNAIGEFGTCMFMWDCIKSEGKHLGTCSDKFLFGSCCYHNITSIETSPTQESSAAQQITMVDYTNSTVHLGQENSGQKFQNSSRYPLNDRMNASYFASTTTTLPITSSISPTIDNNPKQPLNYTENNLQVINSTTIISHPQQASSTGSVNSKFGLDNMQRPSSSNDTIKPVVTNDLSSQQIGTSIPNSWSLVNQQKPLQQHQQQMMIVPVQMRPQRPMVPTNWFQRPVGMFANTFFHTFRPFDFLNFNKRRPPSTQRPPSQQQLQLMPSANYKPIMTAMKHQNPFPFPGIQQHNNLSSSDSQLTSKNLTLTNVDSNPLSLTQIPQQQQPNKHIDSYFSTLNLPLHEIQSIDTGSPINNSTFNNDSSSSNQTNFIQTQDHQHQQQQAYSPSSSLSNVFLSTGNLSSLLSSELDDNMHLENNMAPDHNESYHFHQQHPSPQLGLPATPLEIIHGLSTINSSQENTNNLHISQTNPNKQPDTDTNIVSLGSLAQMTDQNKYPIYETNPKPFNSFGSSLTSAHNQNTNNNHRPTTPSPAPILIGNIDDDPPFSVPSSSSQWPTFPISANTHQSTGSSTLAPQNAAVTSSSPAATMQPQHEFNNSNSTSSSGYQDDNNQMMSVGGRQVQCGSPGVYPQTKVVGGKNAAFGAWPWQVSVRKATFFGLSSTHRCGGALISDEWIATAGHCVEDLHLSTIRIRVGEHDFQSNAEPYPYIERAARRKVVHPKYNFYTYENDLALVQLDSPIRFPPHIAPICLPPDNIELLGRNATVTGWGRLNEGGLLPSVLQEVRVPIVSNDKCKNMFLSAGRPEYIPDIFLCAGYEEGGRDSCQGDSGGPLQVKGDDGKWFLAGIISWGIGCAERNLPGVCTRISRFKQWIQTTMVP